MDSHPSYYKPLNTKKITTFGIGIPGPGLGQAYKCGGVNRLMGSHSSPS